MSVGVEVLTISFVVIVIAAVIGFLARSKNVSLEQWAVGGRNIGALLIWFLLAGEIYTAFTFLGVPGYAYAFGAPAYYALSYGVLAYLTSYFILPKIWRISKKKNIMTQPDFFKERYQSTLLATIVAVVGVVFMVPYLELQVSAITDILEVMGYNVIMPAYVMIITFVLTAGYVIMNGLRSATFTAFFKDGLALIVIFSALIVIPAVQFGDLNNMMHRMVTNYSEYLYFPGHSELGLSWFVSVVLMSALGFFMWPHSFQSYISAKNDNVLKKNAVFLPVYNVLLVITVFMGFAALLYNPHLSNADDAFLIVARASFPSWWNGVVAGAITLGSMVPASVLLIASSTIISKNLYKDLINKKASDSSVKFIAQVFVAIITGVALLFAIEFPALFVNLLLLGYSGITLFFPGIVMGITWRKVTAVGVISGIITGLIVNAVFFLPLSSYSHIIYPGLVGLFADTVVTILVSLVTKAPSGEVIEEFVTA
ncbi:proline permease [Thermoplasma volcanium GSS1]|uniref:Proline permease n=1 Tax=Thermoplasma volcanium (strain ATCC 51530 / DSM 4299 / JCM 9571 / NBRC 15438 / GSS1) TaxID=273116 RepID=Q97CF4_THEVO|nr:sodium:solute symporter [Thermoplasma volcanium]BAB59289.1 proline permease [Thermoplasma volcanium GSS1]